MTSSKIEYSEIAAVAYSREELMKFIENESESWRDGTWGKTFKKGSPLEWFNGLSNWDELDSWGHGIHEEWVEQGSVESYFLSNPEKEVKETA